MVREVFNQLTKRYSPLIKWLIESNQIYTNIDKTIKWCFAWDENLAITAAVDRKTNIISINVLFVDDAYKNNKIFEIEYFLLHEMRHIYQHNQIELYNNNEQTVDSRYIEHWIKEGQNYIKSLDESGNENIEYFKQDCELDAYAFSYAAMHHKYRGIYDSFLFIPEIYKNELKEEYDSAVKDFFDFFE